MHRDLKKLMTKKKKNKTRSLRVEERDTKTIIQY